MTRGFLKGFIFASVKDIADLVGRILIASVFLYEAYDSIFFFEKNLNTLESYGITWNTRLWASLAIVILVLGGITVLIGYFARLGAFLLLLYWLPFTFYVYSWWNDPVELQRLHGLMFMRNLALCGGLCLLLSNGSGNYSVKKLVNTLRLPK